MTWTKERIELVKSLVESGASGEQIGKRLGLTRGSVSRAMSRMGIRIKPRSGNKFYRSAGGTYREETSAAIAQLTSSMCRWPEGDPMTDSGFHFCGAHKNFMLPYCDHHMSIAYPPVSRRNNAGVRQNV